MRCSKPKAGLATKFATVRSAPNTVIHATIKSQRTLCLRFQSEVVTASMKTAENVKAKRAEAKAIPVGPGVAGGWAKAINRDHSAARSSISTRANRNKRRSRPGCQAAPDCDLGRDPAIAAL